MCLPTCERGCVISMWLPFVSVRVPPRLRCTVGNEGIRSGEQIILPKDNEIITHLQLLDEDRKLCKCVCVCAGAFTHQLYIVISPKL